MRILSIAVALLALPMLMSCVIPQATTSPVTAITVDPQVVWVDKDGKNARINIGASDKLHGGQLLYVVRDRKMIGMLTVLKLSAYESECRVTASSRVSQVDMKDSPLGEVRAGDLVMRQFKDVTGAGLPRERVPRMVPVPYDSADNATKTTPVIPRDQVDEWTKMHPRPATNP